MRAPVPLSEESLFGFLASTRLPVVSSLALLIRWLSLALGTAAICYGVTALILFEDGLWHGELPWSGALPALAAAPVFFLAWRDWRQKRLHRAAVVLFVGLFVFTVLANWPRGAFSPAWYLHPVLALLSTMCLGVIGGLLLTLFAVVTLLLGTWLQISGSLSAPIDADAWVHSVSLAAVTLASALAGALVNRLVLLALLTAEHQRRKNFESSRALRHREKLLRHAMRVETVGDLAGMVCHQLRNAFQVLHGHVTLARMGDADEQRRRLEMIEQTLEQSHPLLDQLMRMSHPDDGTTTPCDLAELLRAFYTQALLVMPRNVQVTCETPEHVPTVLLNPHNLVHALWNLVINARQAIEGEGAVTLRCGSDRHQVWLEVADTGTGMPPEVQQRIFDPFFTTKAAGQGTGLGLAAVARFVRSSSGIVQVESEPGRGTTFRMRFPQAHGATRRDEIDPLAEPGSAESGGADAKATG